MKSSSKILICYNSPVSIFPVYNGKPSDDLQPSGNDLSETAFLREIGKVKESLEKYFIDVRTLAIDKNINRTIKEIENHSPDLIVNFVESVEGISEYEFCMAGLFEVLGYQFTGNLPSCLGNSLNKEKTKNILRSFGIRTPASKIIKKKSGFTEKTFNLKYPVIVKLANEDASIGISELSVVNNFKELKKHTDFLFKNYKQDLIAEEYIDGREINAAVLGGEILPLSEIIFNGLPDHLPKIVTYDGKWMEGSVYYEYTKPQCPALIDKETKKKIEETALLAYEAMGCRDYARIDIRLDKKNTPYVIEVNPNPDISSDSGFARAAAASGLSYPELLKTIVNFALVRKESDSQIKAS